MLRPAIPNVFVCDFARALDYYGRVLGFRPLFVYGDVPFYGHVARDAAVLALREVRRPVLDHGAGEDLLSAFIEVEDVDALYGALAAAGALLRQAPRDEPWGMRSAIVADPDGNLLLFAAPLPATR
jgi:uncharacterized glyoxalase superfamily protein PhnB